MKGLLPQKVASLIIDAQRRDYENRSIPSYWLPISKILRYVNNANKNLIIVYTRTHTRTHIHTHNKMYFQIFNNKT